MPNNDQFRRAELLLRLALKTCDPNERAVLIEQAVFWHRAAVADDSTCQRWPEPEVAIITPVSARLDRGRKAGGTTRGPRAG